VVTTSRTRKRRGGGPRAIAATLPAVTGTAFAKRGFTGAGVLNEWPLIAGSHLARHSAPEKVQPPARGDTGGTLHLRIDNGAMATELQHLAPLLIERINGYFGYNAVARLKIIQGPLSKPPRRPPPRTRPLTASEETELAKNLMDVDDPDLRRSLAALGRAVMARRAAKGPD